MGGEHRPQAVILINPVYLGDERVVGGNGHFCQMAAGHDDGRGHLGEPRRHQSLCQQAFEPAHARPARIFPEIHQPLPLSLDQCVRPLLKCHIPFCKAWKIRVYLAPGS